MNRVTENEWTLIWASLRYFLGRETIASATYPQMIMKNYYHRLSDAQTKSMYEDIKRHFDLMGGIGNEIIDKPIWLKFAAALNTIDHIEYELKTGEKIMCFEANNKIYPLDKYISDPHCEIWIKPSSIKPQTP